jgi:hypothetical protein
MMYYYDEISAVLMYAKIASSLVRWRATAPSTTSTHVFRYVVSVAT